jgi:ChpA-C
VLKKLAATGVLGLAMAAAALAATPAHADPETTGHNSILGGNQLLNPISIPTTICGNAISLAGIAGTGCRGEATAEAGTRSAPGPKGTPKTTHPNAQPANR